MQILPLQRSGIAFCSTEPSFGVIDGKGNPCPSYTDLRVNPPDTSVVYTVPAAIDACELQVHPITGGQ